jgi:uncharacterized protein YndB with AHSA1/START domain
MKWLKWIFIVPVALLAIAFATLLVLSHLPGADKIHASVEIAASPQTIWPWLNEGDKLKQWVSWLAEVKQTEPRALGASQTWVMHDANNGGAPMSIASRCTEFTPPKRLGVTVNVPNAFDGSQTYAITDLGNNRSRLDIDGEYRFTQWFASLMTPLIMPAAAKKMEGDIATLKRLTEK